MNAARFDSARTVPPGRDLTPTATAQAKLPDCAALASLHPGALTVAVTESRFRVVAIVQVSGKRISPLGVSGQRMTIPSAGPARRTGVSVDRSSAAGAMSGAYRRGEAGAADKWI